MIQSELGKKIDFEAVRKFQEETEEWYATCKKCGVKLKGTLAQMRAHTCEVPHGE